MEAENLGEASEAHEIRSAPRGGVPVVVEAGSQLLGIGFTRSVARERLGLPALMIEFRATADLPGDRARQAASAIDRALGGGSA